MNGKYSYFAWRTLAPLLALSFAILPSPVPAPAQTAPATFAAPPVGQLLKVRGAVWIGKGGKKDAAQSLDTVRTGDRIMVGVGGEAVAVWYASGAKMALAPGCVGEMGGKGWVPVSGPAPRPLPSVSRRLIPPVAPRRRFGPNHGGFIVRVNTPGTGAPAPKARDVFVTVPWGAVRRADNLTVRWEASRSRAALPATVQVTARDEALPKSKPVLLTRTLKGAEWTQTSANAARLQPGMIGDVTVTIGDATDRVPFRILTGPERELIEAAEKEAATARATDQTDPTPDTLLAQQYDALELYADALAAYRRALKLAPGDKGLQAMVASLEQGGK